MLVVPLPQYQYRSLYNILLFSFLSEILCLEPPTPVNGDAVLSSQGMSVGTTANYSCDSGYVLVGQAIRTCEDVNGDIIGRWSGTTPICEGTNSQQKLIQKQN